MSISSVLKQQVRQRANCLCEYCHSPEKISTSRFTIDHIYPRSLGGSTLTTAATGAIALFKRPAPSGYKLDGTRHQQICVSQSIQTPDCG